MIEMDALYDQLIKATLKQNKMLEQQLGIKQNNYDKLYLKTEIPFNERILTIRWVKIPTFIQENKPTYYAIFLTDIAFWRKGELKKIYKQVIESIDSHDLDSHTIFLAGILYGFFDKMNNQPKHYHIFRLNTDKITTSENKQILDCICNYLQSRIQIMTTKIKTKTTQKDIDRLQFFIDTFSYMRVYHRYARYVSNTSHRKEVIETNTTSNSLRHHNARGGME